MEPDEAAYLATRSDQLMSRTRFTRRDVLRMGAATVGGRRRRAVRRPRHGESGNPGRHRTDSEAAAP